MDGLSLGWFSAHTTALVSWSLGHCALTFKYYAVSSTEMINLVTSHLRTATSLTHYLPLVYQYYAVHLTIGHTFSSAHQIVPNKGYHVKEAINVIDY